MTTSPVVSVTDELIAELEDELECCGSYNLDVDEIAALLAERAELKRDADRLEWLMSQKAAICEQNGAKIETIYRVFWPFGKYRLDDWYDSPRAAIDAAMQS